MPPSDPPFSRSERPLGALYTGNDQTLFRLWAPTAESVEVRLLGQTPDLDRSFPLIPEEDGHHRATIEGARPGQRYVYRVDGVDFPDPASRLQPEGVGGPSEITCARAETRGFSPRPLRDQVLYELHVGTFTEQGTFDSAIPRLDDLVDLGVTTVELLPVATFSGDRNWGYDGVFPLSVHHAYGGPEGLSRFVDACHARDLAVVLDVVYNHLGPEGAVLHRLGPYFSDRHRTPWGSAFNFDGEHSDEVRSLFLTAALYFITDLGLDGLRLDAVNMMFDASPRPFLEELGDAVRARATELGKTVHLIGEGDSNDPRLVEPPKSGGLGLDALWNDDFHHALHALLTGERGGYYADYGAVSHLARALREGFTYAGEKSQFRKRRHGRSSAHLPADTMIVYAQNHDQVGNRPRGDRLFSLVGFEKSKLAAAVTLLSPYVPLLFMGEEYGEIAPFAYFTSHRDPGLARAVREGRKASLKPFHFPGEPFDPQSKDTFLASKLDPGRATSGVHATTRAYYKTLLRLRRETPALRSPDKQALSVLDLAPEEALFLRRSAEGSEIAALFSFAHAPVDVTIPLQGVWHKLLDSASPEHGGPGSLSPEELQAEGSARLRLAPSSAVVYARRTPAPPFSPPKSP